MRVRCPWVFLLAASIILLGATCLWAGELQEFKGVKYVPDNSND